MSRLADCAGAATLFVVLLLAGLAPATATAQRGGHYTLVIENESRYDIYYLYMSRTLEGDWGRDRLGPEVLGAGETFALENILAGEYDVKFVDEDEDACILNDIAIVNDTEWSLTTGFLLKCDGYRE